MYDKVVSLGYNCEVSFRIEDYFGSIDAMPFSWSFTLNRDKFADAMREPEKLLSEGITVRDDHMLMCNRYELKFHPRYSIFPQFGEYTEEQLTEATAELTDRVKHLADKFNNLCNSDLRTLFVMKVEDKGTEDNKKYIESVLNTLNTKYVSGNFTLAAVVLESAVNDDILALASDKVKIFSVKKFAPIKHTNIMGDMSGWKYIFSVLEPDLAGKNKFYSKVNARRRKWFFETLKRKLKIGER
ncbi:MAG: hypothetical protein IK018_10370 [Lachnospiraceae bacterium]|nr:hypothetical protein [Lachnospiraceae bacterium]